jgi:hypothetical protein
MGERGSGGGALDRCARAHDTLEVVHRPATVVCKVLCLTAGEELTPRSLDRRVEVEANM